MKKFAEFFDDCDIDCQKFGSGMNIVAILNATVLGLIGLNALFMLIGTWRYRWRVCSVYFTLFMCVFQFVVLILSGTMLFSKYSLTFCSNSLTETAPGLMWTMADDWQMNINLWVSQLILMFVWLCFGLCSAY